MVKIIFTAFFCCTFYFCSAQKQLLTYVDLQYIIQNKPAQVTTFLKEKDYQIVPGSDSNNLHFLSLIADEVYTDVAINFDKRHTNIHLTTTAQPQLALIETAIQIYPNKNSKGSILYRIKDEAIATIAIKENEPQKNSFKVYTINIEN